MTDGAVLNVALRWEVVYCYKCGIGFAIGADIRGRWVDKGTVFYCPNGHNQSYVEPTEAVLRKQLEAAKKEVENERKRKEWAQQDAENEREKRRGVDRQLRAQRGATKRIKNRISNGVCPCCTRSFTNLRRHMQTKHPDFRTQAVAALTESA